MQPNATRVLRTLHRHRTRQTGVPAGGEVLDEHPVELVVKPVAVAAPNGGATDSLPKQEAITTGAMPSGAAKSELVIAPSIDVESAAATTLSKSQPPDGAPRRQEAAVTAPAPVKPAAVAGPSGPEADAAPDQRQSSRRLRHPCTCLRPRCSSRRRSTPRPQLRRDSTSASAAARRIFHPAPLCASWACPAA
jgi:hypothetical protein